MSLHPNTLKTQIYTEDTKNLTFLFLEAMTMTKTFSDVSQFDTFAYFYAISNFYFLLNISVTHGPRITNTFVLVHPVHL